MNAAVIGPMLRGLWAKDGRLPLVCRTDRPGTPLPPRTDELELFEAAKSLVSLGCDAIEVPDLGVLSPIFSQGDGRLAGKVAMVTGAAQGFGAGIAESLADEGCRVVLADLNLAKAQELAAQVHGLAVRIDVSDNGSVKRAVEEVCIAYGGVDLFVSNAGVLKAGSVLSQPAEDFQFVTRVNYEGFFHCVQAVAPVMARQRLALPDVWFDIVQINSKSGLQGSSKNGAYAGGKFGGIGLTQSFALELVEHGIKVNAICPGNFFDGPLWSDPDNGLFAQYLRTGKVPGAQNIHDVKRFYEAKVPMGRGCTVQDVMRALMYTVEQQYETGQAVPVTGGQVMLS